MEESTSVDIAKRQSITRFNISSIIKIDINTTTLQTNLPKNNLQKNKDKDKCKCKCKCKVKINLSLMVKS
jgi:hypothetical protein